MTRQKSEPADVRRRNLDPHRGLFNKFKVTQHAMERGLCSMLGVSLRHSIQIHRRTQVTRIAQRICQLKWQWVPIFVTESTAVDVNVFC